MYKYCQEQATTFGKAERSFQRKKGGTVKVTLTYIQYPCVKMCKQEKALFPNETRLFWSYLPDLNRWSADYESAALPTEPQ